MKDDLSSIFHKPEFKQLLAKYSDMIENHTSITWNLTKSPYWPNFTPVW